MKTTFYLFIFLLPLTSFAHAKHVYYGSIYAHINFESLDKNKRNLVFIHGTPGSHKAFNAYFNDQEFNKNYNMLSLDRPGFGQSTRFTSLRHPDMSAQAQMISDSLLMAFPKSTKFAIMAHSYGAPLATLIARQLEDKVSHLFLISGPFSPEITTSRWYNRLAAHEWIQWALPGVIRKSNQEMLALDKNLQNRVSYAVTDNSMPFHFIHGSSDWIVDIKHSQWAHKTRTTNKRPSHIHKLDGGHFILWTAPDKIKKILLKEYNFSTP